MRPYGTEMSLFDDEVVVQLTRMDHEDGKFRLTGPGTVKMQGSYRLMLTFEGQAHYNERPSRGIYDLVLSKMTDPCA